LCSSNAACTASATSCASRRASISLVISSTRAGSAATSWSSAGCAPRAGAGLANGAQQVQRHDVARAFPDGVERHLAVDAGHDALAALFHVAVAAQALHGFLREVAA